MQSPAPILYPCSMCLDEPTKQHVFLAVAQLLFPKGSCPRSRGLAPKVMKEIQHLALLTTCLSICLSVHPSIYPPILVISRLAELCAVLGTWEEI